MTAGTTITTQFLVADRDTAGRVAVFLDQDQNPYNGISRVTSKGFSSTQLDAVRLNVGTTGLTAGSYYLAAQSTDAQGHTRWNYSPLKITIKPPVTGDFVTTANGVMTVTGTDAADVISISNRNSSYTVTLNGVGVLIAQSAVSRIVVQAGAGNDTVDLATVGVPAYVNAGAGFDNVTGGLGNDTLSGGAQSDTLTGNAGDDVLNGNGGNNLLVGNGGYDRLYSADGSQDTMIGGSNADRFFGGSGNDSMIGGTGNDKMYANAGNDTLIGGEGTDIINGGPGTDTADDDSNDLRTDIETLLSA